MRSSHFRLCALESAAPVLLESGHSALSWVASQACRRCNMLTAIILQAWAQILTAWNGEIPTGMSLTERSSLQPCDQDVDPSRLPLIALEYDAFARIQQGPAGKYWAA